MSKHSPNRRIVENIQESLDNQSTTTKDYSNNKYEVGSMSTTAADKAGDVPIPEDEEWSWDKEKASTRKRIERVNATAPGLKRLTERGMSLDDTIICIKMALDKPFLPLDKPWIVIRDLPVTFVYEQKMLYTIGVSKIGMDPREGVALIEVFLWGPNADEEPKLNVFKGFPDTPKFRVNGGQADVEYVQTPEWLIESSKGM